MTNPWQGVPGAPGISRAKYQIPGTTPYSALIDLGDDRFLIHSPGPGLESTLPESVSPSSKILLLAPCIGHTLGMVPWLTGHPESDSYAPEAIHAKIIENGFQGELQSIEKLAEQLPEFVSVHVPPPNKFQEIWLSVRQGDTTYWIVGDAFLNFESVEGNFIKKFLLGLYGIKPGLRLHKLFRFGLQDKDEFRKWAEPLFAKQGKQVLLPCHREIYDAADCGERLSRIVREVA